MLARDRGLLCWQHADPERPDRLAVLIAEKDGELVGMMGLIPFTACLRGTAAPGAWLTTWQVRPGRDVQSTGLRLLGQALGQGYALAGTVGANAYVMPAFEALRFATWDSVPRWVRAGSPDALATLLATRPDRYPAEVVEAWLQTAEQAPLDAGDDLRTVPWHERLAARWDVCWRQRFASSVLGAARDARYLRWRYAEHPRFTYHIRFAQTRIGGHLHGLIVYRVERIRDRAETVVRVVELLADADAGSALVRDLLDDAEQERAALIDFFCTGPRFAAPLEAAGFAREDRMPSALPSLFQPLEAEPRPLRAALRVDRSVAADAAGYLHSPDLYLTRSDCDQDRPNEPPPA